MPASYIYYIPDSEDLSLVQQQGNLTATTSYSGLAVFDPTESLLIVIVVISDHSWKELVCYEIMF